MINDYELLLRLLYIALIEIRAESVSYENKKIFHISDLFHNTPLQIYAQSSGGDFVEAVSWLRGRAEQKGMTGWLEHTIAEIERMRNRSSPGT